MSTVYLPELSELIFPRQQAPRIIYWIIIMMIVLVFMLMPVIKLDISVRSPGVIRPASERTVIRSIVTGVIQDLNFVDGDYVEKDSVIFTVRDNITQPKLQTLRFEMEHKKQFIHDLKLILKENTAATPAPRLSTPLYQGQLNRYQFQLRDHLVSLAKVNKELETDSLLYRDKVIAAKEYYDKVTESKRFAAGLKAFESEQLVQWQQQLIQAEKELSELLSAHKLLLEETTRYQVRAPVAGYLQGLSTQYEGAMVGSGEIFCELSPDTELIAECYVSTRDIGLLKKDQSVIFQVDAYDYNYFGVITGKIARIDDDFTIQDDLPLYKVRCVFDRTWLKSKKGYKGNLKKGLSLQARFLVARRSAWDLIFDKIDDWLNPVAF